MKSWLLATQRQLSRQICDNKLPHALLFSGVAHAGHDEIAHWLVSVLLCQHRTNNQALIADISSTKPTTEQTILQPCGQCKTCQLFAGANYPDHLSIVSEKNTLGVDLIRKLSQFFEKTAHIGKLKTALINDADTMTIGAANALLKTLEEPTSNSFIILTTDNADLLLPTIVSRCQTIGIRPPVGEKLLAEYHQHGGDAFINLSHINELTDQSAAIAFKSFRDMVELYLSHGQHRSEILSTLVDHSDGFRWLEKVLTDLMRQQWSWQSTQSQDAQAIATSKQQLWQIYNFVQKANLKLKTLVQVNRQFLSEQLLADIRCVIIKKHEK
ncbi:MAG: DNA polymerase III subunit delta' [Cognaticolwellia sp.]